MAQSKDFAQRLKALIGALAVMVVAAVSLVAMPAGARAAELTYASEQIAGVTDQPGFKWVAATEDEPAHYLVYNPLGDEWSGSHESGIGWWHFANYSREHDFNGYLIKLDSDLSFKDYDFQRDGDDPNQLSVGTEDRPFKGTFDGAGHTISNLTNEREGLSIQMDNGFFGWTNQATIKNVNFKDCYIGGSYRDGLVSGYAQDTFFLNILCENCTTSVIPANNVLNLITNAGISGGTIAGVANGCTLYNCEMRAGRVVSNSTAGVAALGGQPLYMGGLVGFANDTTIEYSRVTDMWVRDENGAVKKNEYGTYQRSYAQISGTYETGVSVANYSEVYCGGIVGGMQREDTGTKIVDCYSTADVYGKAAIYFGVGLGLGVTRGYCGGIAGIVWDGGEGENLIERVHYAGNLHSYQYNQLLLGIPIIERDAYMGGIVSVGGGNAKINQAYFKRGASSTDKTILSYQNWTTDTDGPADGGAFGPRDESYTDRDYWEGHDFDFAAGKVRNYGYEFTEHLSEDEWTNDHYNKWTMDYNRGIPVHGGSVKATLDFPGSGEVTIGYTNMAWDANGASTGVGDDPNAQKTTNPYYFAVQGYEQYDERITLRYALAENEEDKNVSWAADEQNEGYRIIGWYGSRDVRVNALPSSHKYFTSHNTMLDTDDCGQGILSAAKGENAGAIGDSHESDVTHLIKANENAGATSLELTVNWPIGDEAAEDWRDPDPDNAEGAESETKPRYPEFSDNDLYIAHAQAQVLLHDVEGHIIKKDGTAEEAPDKTDDWYEYEEKLTLPEFVVADEGKVSTDVTFVGWTTKPTGDGKGYDNATPTDIAELKGANAFFEPGSLYSVTQPVNLYPVYVGLTGNVTVIFEGNDQDTPDDGDQYEGENDVSKRDGYGQAVVRTDEGGNYIALDDISGTEGVSTDNDAIDLTTSPLYENYDAEDTAIVDGAQMRFLGWYETITDNDGNSFEVRVSNEQKFYLTDVDLTQQHTYTARFEYCVRYWWDADTANDDGAAPYSLDWVRYESERYDPSIFGTGEHSFIQWLTGGYADSAYVLNPTDANAQHANESSAAVDEIVYPVSFHGEWNRDASGANVEVQTDFPTGPLFTVDFNGSYTDHLIVDMPRGNDSGFNFHLWSGENNQLSPWKTAVSTTRWDASNNYVDALRLYWFQARVTADVTFHGLASEGSLNTTVERRYGKNAFAADEGKYQYVLNTPDEIDVDGVTSTYDFPAAPTDAEMSRNGYIFLGWIDKNLITDNEFDYIFNGNTIEGTDVKVVKDVDRALPYMVTSSDTIEVRHPMDFYPVYIGFDLETTTNIAQADVDDSIYNIPGDPGIADAATDGGNKVQVDYNRDCGTLIGGFSNPVKISCNENNGASINITVDVNKPVWKDADGLTEEQESEEYTFVSLTVTKDGEVVDTLYPEEIGDEELTYTFESYAIESGSSYVFTANYSPVPVMVIYHLRADETANGANDDLDTFSVEVGDLLPFTSKTPWFAGYDDEGSLGENKFFVGWTVGEEKGCPVDWEAEGNPVLAQPNADTVTGTTHLWPVYRKSNIQLASSIDGAEGVPDGNTHRRATKHANDPSNLWLEADEVPGYEFKGWTTEYNDETGVYGTLFTASSQTALSGDARFQTGVTYTAIYEKVAAQVRYHDMDGNVIYTASVANGDGWDPEDPTSDPADNPNRSFVYTTTVDEPQYKPDGTPVLNPDGSQLTESVEKTVPIDMDAFTAIYAAVDAKNAENTGQYMTFVTWQLVDTENGDPERWGDANAWGSFVSKPITDQVSPDNNTLDLYPIVATITARDADDKTYPVISQFELDAGENKISAANITLLESYGQEYLRAHLDEIAYSPDASDENEVQEEITPLESIPVKLYGVGSSMDEPMASDTTRSDEDTVTLPSGGAVELDKGDAIFTFTGYINITKRTTDANAAGKTFAFTVSEKTEDGTSAKARRVTVKVGETASGGYYSGSAKIAVPFGEYTVSEDDAWAWRYNVGLEKWEKAEGGTYTWTDAENNADVTVTYTSEVSAGNLDGATSTVRATNTRDNNKWSDGSDYAHNVFNGESNENEGGN